MSASPAEPAVAANLDRLPAPSPLPRVIDLRAAFVAPFDQTGTELCAPVALAAVLDVELRTAGLVEAGPVSLLFLDYETRHGRDGAPLPAGPVDMPDCLAAVRRSGVCPEALWPFARARRDLRPPEQAYRCARDLGGVDFQPVPRRLDAMLGLLADGHPFVCGLRVYQSFWGSRSRRSGAIALPIRRERETGGHAVVIAGYEREREVFIFRNSFGAQWGDGGYGTLPFAYLLSDHLAFDLWSVTAVGRRRMQHPDR